MTPQAAILKVLPQPSKRRSRPSPASKVRGGGPTLHGRRKWARVAGNRQHAGGKKPRTSFVTVERMLQALGIEQSAGTAKNPERCRRQTGRPEPRRSRTSGRGRTADTASARERLRCAQAVCPRSHFPRRVTGKTRSGDRPRRRNQAHQSKCCPRRTKNNPVLIGEPGGWQNGDRRRPWPCGSSMAMCRKA